MATTAAEFKGYHIHRHGQKVVIPVCDEPLLIVRLIAAPRRHGAKVARSDEQRMQWMIHHLRALDGDRLRAL